VVQAADHRQPPRARRQPDAVAAVALADELPEEEEQGREEQSQEEAQVVERRLLHGSTELMAGELLQASWRCRTDEAGNKEVCLIGRRKRCVLQLRTPTDKTFLRRFPFPDLLCSFVICGRQLSASPSSSSTRDAALAFQPRRGVATAG